MDPRRAIVRILWAWVAAATACAPEPGTPPPPFSVEDGFIKDEAGRVVLLQGVNLSGGHKGPPYFDFHGAEDFRAVRERLGMNAVRFLLQWAAVEPTAGAYDEAYLDAVRLRMDWAADAGLLVVLDMHQDLYGEGFAGGNGAPRWTCAEERYAAYEPPEDWFFGYLDENVTACFDGLWTDPALQDAYAAAWAHVAERLADHAAILGFEVINEPWQGSFGLESFEPSALQPFYERVVPAVRDVAPHWLAFLEPSSMSNLGRASFLEPFPFEGVVYAPHSYDPSFERGEGFDDDNRALAMDKLAQLAMEARHLGAALWIGEFGGDADLPGIAPYMDAEMDAFASVLAGAAYWDFSKGDGFGLLDASGAEKTAIWDAIVRPTPERIAGTLVGYNFDDATATFTLSYEAASAAPSWVRVPDRAYPDGFAVECSGGTATTSGATVEVVAEPQATVTLTVRPATP